MIEQDSPSDRVSQLSVMDVAQDIIEGMVAEDENGIGEFDLSPDYDIGANPDEIGQDTPRSTASNPLGKVISIGDFSRYKK